MFDNDDGDYEMDLSSSLSVESATDFSAQLAPVRLAPAARPSFHSSALSTPPTVLSSSPIHSAGSTVAAAAAVVEDPTLPILQGRVTFSPIYVLFLRHCICVDGGLVEDPGQLLPELLQSWHAFLPDAKHC